VSASPGRDASAGSAPVAGSVTSAAEGSAASSLGGSADGSFGGSADGSLGTAAGPTGTAAPTGAAARVVDAAAVLSASDRRDVVAAIDAVTGYRVFVVTTPADSGSLEDDLHDLGEAAGWTGIDWDSDAIILALGVQSREIGIYYGSMAYQLVEPASDDIYDAMAEGFRRSEWASGFLAGIKAAYAAITGAPSPRSSDRTSSDYRDDGYGSDDSGYSADASSDSASSGLSGWVIVLIILVVGSVLWRLFRGAGSGDNYGDGSGDDDSGSDDSWGGSNWNSRRRSSWGSRSGGWFGGGSGGSGGWSSGGSSRRSWGGSSRRSSGGSSRRSFGGSSRRSSGGSSHRSSRGGGGSRHF
jgi:hypothetical protein